MFERFRRLTAAHLSAPADPHDAAGPQTDTPAGTPRHARSADDPATAAASLAGLARLVRPGAMLSRARDKMRHRRRDFIVPLYQSQDAGQSISPADVRRPRTHKRVATAIPANAEDSAVSASASAVPTQASLPRRMARYDAAVKIRTVPAASATADKRDAAMADRPRGSMPEAPQAAACLRASCGAEALRRFIDDVLPAHSDTASAGSGEVADGANGSNGSNGSTIPGTAHTTAIAGTASADRPQLPLSPEPASRIAALRDQQELSQRLATLGTVPGGPPTSRGALIVVALAQADVRSPRRANEVIEQIASMPLARATHLFDIARSRSDAEGNTEDNTRGDAEVTRQACIVMQSLARGNALNFDALMALRAQGGQPFTSDSQAAAFRTLLGVADHIAQRDRISEPSASPGEAHTYAHRCRDAALRVLKGGRDALPEAQRFDLFEWRQGDRDDGPGSKASRKRHRIDKFTKQSIPRVAEGRLDRLMTAPQRLVGWHKSPLSAASLGFGGVPRDTLAKEQSAVATAMRRALDELTAIAPAAAENTHGAQRPPYPDAALAHADAVGSMIELAALHVWLQAADVDGTGLFPNGHINDAGLVEVARRAAVLAESGELRESNEPSASDRPSSLSAVTHGNAGAGRNEEAGREDVRARLAALSALPAATLRRTPPFDALAKRSFSVDRLAKWGDAAQIPRNDDAPFWQSVARLRASLAPEEKRLEVRDVDHARDLLVEAVGALKGGSRLRLSDGHRYGVSTRGLSVLFSNAVHLSGVPMSVQTNLRATKGREAVVELSRSTHGVEIFIGTAERVATHAEAGVFLGYRFDLGLAEARAGGAVNALVYAGERSNASGVTIGIARPVRDDGTGYQDDVMLRKASDIMAALFAEASPATQADGTPAVADAPATSARTASAAQRVFAQYFDDPHISLAWTDTSSRNHGAGVSANAGVTLRLPDHVQHIAALPEGNGMVTPAHTEHGLLPVGIGPTVGVAYLRDYAQRQDTPSQQTRSSARAASDVPQGAQQVTLRRAGGGTRLIGRLGLGTSTSTPVGEVVHRPDGSPDGRMLSLGVLSLDTPAFNVTFREGRMSAKLQLVRDGQQLNHRACMLDREFASPSAYIEAVESERPLWAQLFAAEHTPADAGGPSADVLAAANKRIDMHLEKARANWRPNQTLFTRHRLREHAARALDFNAAVRDQLSGNAEDRSDATLVSLDEADAAILRDPNSYMPIELKGKDNTGHEQLIGLNAFLHLGTRKASAATREFAADNVSFATMDRLDRALPRS